MKAVKGYTKEDYMRGPVNKEFASIDAAAEYLANKYHSNPEYMRESILNDTNCDAVYFPDGSVIITELI